MLLNCTHFIDLFMGINTSNETLLLFKKFIYEYKTSETSLAPTNLKKMMNKFSQFQGFNQHDANEFLIYLLDLIDIELKKQNVDIITSFFDHKFYTKIVNSDNDDEEKIIKFNERILNLPISKNLNDSYIKYCAVEMIEGWESEKYNKKCLAKKKNVVYQWPIYLTIMFKKYDSNLRKIDDDVEIPMIWKIYNINNSHKEIITYQFIGSVIHFGNLFGGHYIGVVYRDGKYYLCNDASVSEIDTEKASQIMI
jgi:ubiquitin C-terminal hydrolase